MEERAVDIPAAASAPGVRDDGPERGPPAQVALVRPVELPQGSCFVVTDEDGRPLVVAPDLAGAQRIARFFGLAPATVH
ncbi:hypothetical protein HRbin39_00301 [bacterium HR39]|nr:hypothetical protein HRbin39_00301 [bacterium HR39]